MSRFDEDPVFEVVSDPADKELDGFGVEPLADVIGDDAAARVDEYLKHPETGVRRERPQR